ncbi:hypothetical protein HNP38_002142 [Chryseobacterium defluvii]|uniref:Uncharacterized protein n=1 Tax=Chryseobacterium defluvii TaxID=160396 RepID=A0A840KCC7_9FLAO|nr:hypothetical protein [Chryseobacterium defluvii]MBB4806846.1 hypothetical protein [Chryseobacterium defluvii]
MKYCILLLLAFLLKCQDYKPGVNQENRKETTIEGTALNFKEGARLQTDSVMYIIDSLSGWPEELDHKKMIVKGILKTRKYKVGKLEKISENDVIPPQVSSIPANTEVIEHRLLHAEWEVLPDSTDDAINKY